MFCTRCLVTSVALAGAVVALSLQTPARARAQILGFDSAVLSAILAEEIAQVAQLVQTVVSLETQIRQLTTMIQQGDTMLAAFRSPEDLLTALRYSQRVLRKRDGIEKNVRLLHFKLDAIDQDRLEVFPELGPVATADIPQKARTWNAALKESSAIAMRAQTNVATLQERLDASDALQGHSAQAPGIVGQLQLVVQQLGLIHTALGSIEANLAYGQRVTATMAGVQAAEQERHEEEGRRMMLNYTDRGPPPRVLTELP